MAIPSFQDQELLSIIHAYALPSPLRHFYMALNADRRHSCTRVWVPPVALHVLRYPCRSRFLQNPEVLEV